MSDDVTANGRTIVHKGDGLVNVDTLPDVCKTPTPAGPAPVPYVNVARDSDLADGTKRVKIEGNPVAHEKSKLKQSSGDEPGTLGGIISGKNRGKMTWGSSSPNVLFEGRSVVRFADQNHHNCNTFNVLYLQNGQKITIVNYGDDAACPICGKDSPENNHLILPDSAPSDDRAKAKMDALFQELDKRWNNGDRDVLVEHSLEKRATGSAGAPTGRFGYMVAILVCECGKYFGACSGTVAGSFNAACKEVGVEVAPGAPQETFSAYARKVYQDSPLWTAFLASHQKRHGQVAKNKLQGILSKGVQDFSRAMSPEILDEDDSSNGFGICAGPRAIAVALSKTPAHSPRMLCERLFRPPYAHNAGTGVKVVSRENVFRNVPIDITEVPSLDLRQYSVLNASHALGHGESVPSCATCDNLIPALLCAAKRNC